MNLNKKIKNLLITFLTAITLCNTISHTALAFGNDDLFTPALLEIGGVGASKTRENGVNRLLYTVEKRTSIKTQSVKRVSVKDKNLYNYPFLYLSGDRAIKDVDGVEVDRLRTYLNSGGFLFIDSAEGIAEGPFWNSAKKLVHELFPEKKLTPIGDSHVIYSSFYLLDQPYGRTVVDRKLYGIYDHNRLVVILHANDLAGALARDPAGYWLFDLLPSSPRQREFAHRFAVNLAMYATCLNYKKDQAHIPFIMKRRKWKSVE